MHPGSRRLARRSCLVTVTEFLDVDSVTVEIPGTEEFGELDWRRHHMWCDRSDGLPRVVAVWLWGWTP